MGNAMNYTVHMENFDNVHDGSPLLKRRLKAIHEPLFHVFSSAQVGKIAAF